ncbi:Uncharacterized protein Adt_12404 [Abeliophyllum distichum]|uniref:Uncharacterized protein n=1 Tax=Abeliophyllum distichum TaxID=126358 RepID=A0ABD1UQN8_9LAMI
MRSSSIQNTPTLQYSYPQMNENRKKKVQWMANTKGFDTESGPSTLPFEGSEAMDEDDDDEEDVPPLSHPSDVLSSHIPSSSASNFSFTKHHYNLLNVRIDSLTSTVDDLQNTV